MCLSYNFYAVSIYIESVMRFINHFCHRGTYISRTIVIFQIASLFLGIKYDVIYYDAFFWFVWLENMILIHLQLYEYNYCLCMKWVIGALFWYNYLTAILDIVSLEMKVCIKNELYCDNTMSIRKSLFTKMLGFPLYIYFCTKRIH